MPLKPMYKDYYTAAQAMKVLGITDGMFYNFVRNKDIEGVSLPGRKQNLYEKKQIDRLARELQLFVGTRPKTHSQFAQLTSDDLLECAKISDMIFGSHIDIERQKSWLARNPEIGYVLKSEGQAVGYLLILPLLPEKIDRLLAEDELAINIDAREILPFDPGKPLYLYGTAIGILPGLTLAEKRAYGARLVGGFIDILLAMGKRGVIINTIVARSTKPDGIRLLRNLGFTLVPSSTEKKNFILRIEESGAREVLQYKQVLQEYGFWTPKPFHLAPPH